ncbi:MAG: hypothetical protein COS92_08445 [Desulfobacterales bacterium CG07_land_8_20_14_0_80_52_14]|nr:MAG: hypothetical protein COX20_12625 [Desulfobacterales bacterium CG23_combo_of_CG06-09_8_20_14_all_52_9]PIU49095.1 MAG: hypothetical protein COS92_08445 [Desulfobacterales bacterium CG07_land_8_20_14_0_80_52_14]
MVRLSDSSKKSHPKDIFRLPVSWAFKKILYQKIRWGAPALFGFQELFGGKSTIKRFFRVFSEKSLGRRIDCA